MKIYLANFSEQREHAQRLAEALREAGHEVAVEQDVLTSGGNLRSTNELLESQLLVLLMSPEWIQHHTDRSLWRSIDDGTGTWTGQVLCLAVDPMGEGELIALWDRGAWLVASRGPREDDPLGRRIRELVELVELIELVELAIFVAATDLLESDRSVDRDLRRLVEQIRQDISSEQVNRLWRASEANQAPLVDRITQMRESWEFWPDWPDWPKLVDRRGRPDRLDWVLLFNSATPNLGAFRIALQDLDSQTQLRLRERFRFFESLSTRELLERLARIIEHGFFETLEPESPSPAALESSLSPRPSPPELKSLLPAFRRAFRPLVRPHLRLELRLASLLALFLATSVLLVERCDFLHPTPPSEYGGETGEVLVYTYIPSIRRHDACTTPREFEVMLSEFMQSARCYQIATTPLLFSCNSPSGEPTYLLFTVRLVPEIHGAFQVSLQWHGHLSDLQQQFAGARESSGDVCGVDMQYIATATDGGTVKVYEYNSEDECAQIPCPSKCTEYQEFGRSLIEDAPPTCSAAQENDKVILRCEDSTPNLPCTSVLEGTFWLVPHERQFFSVAYSGRSVQQCSTGAFATAQGEAPDFGRGAPRFAVELASECDSPDTTLMKFFDAPVEWGMTPDAASEALGPVQEHDPNFKCPRLRLLTSNHPNEFADSTELAFLDGELVGAWFTALRDPDREKSYVDGFREQNIEHEYRPHPELERPLTRVGISDSDEYYPRAWVVRDPQFGVFLDALRDCESDALRR